MKKILLLASAFLSIPAAAHEITSPFYLPEMGHVLSQTSALYSKNKITTSPTTRTYRTTIVEELTLGLGAGLAALMNGDLNWTRQKQDKTLSAPHTKGYAAGLKGQWEVNGLLTQFSGLYHQTTEVDFSARRLLETHFRFGKQLKTMTPYVHLQGNFPLHARSHFNNPLYRVETGVFQQVSPKTTLDTALYLQYDKNVKGKSYGIRGEYSYLATQWMAISINGQWQARGHAKAHEKTYHQQIGTKISFSF